MTSSVRERTRPVPRDPADGRPRQRPSAAGRTIALVTALVLVAGGIMLWFTPLLGLRSVEVQSAGTAAVTAAVVGEVQAAVGVPDGTPLARIGLDGVRDRVLAVDAVASATVERQWPHTLVVTVSERVAVATVQANGRWWLLDATGTPFGELTARPDGLMPVQLARPGRGDRATLAALGVLASLSPEVRGRVAGISAATAYDVTLFLSGGGSVIWGSDGDAAAKNAAVPAMLQTVGGAAGRILDVSDPTLVTVRDAQPGGATAESDDGD
jgi:cell division protein FtsQ